MRTTFLLVLTTVGYIACTKEAFVKKARNLLLGPKLTDAMINKVLPLASEPILQQKTLKEVGQNVVNKIPSVVLSFTSLLPTYTGAEYCLKKAGTTLSKTLNKILPAFETVLKAPYKTLQTMIAKKTNEGMKIADIEKEAYKKSCAIMTKALIKKLIINAKKKCCCSEWACADQYLNQLIKLSDYDDKDDNTCKKC